METTAKPRSSTDKEAKVITLIFSPDEDKDRLYRLPRDTALRDVIAKWTKDCRPATAVLLFPDDCNQPLDDGALLESLSCAPDVQVSLHAVPAHFSVLVQLLNSSKPPQKLDVSPMDLPEQLIPKISKLFELPIEQRFRLKLEQRLLEEEKAIWRQEVVAESVLSVEVEFSGTVHDRYTGDFICDFASFASDPVSDLKCPPYLAVQRFWLKERQLPSQGTIAEAFAGCPTFDLKLEVERQQSVRWMRGLELCAPRDLWPSSRLPAPPKPSNYLQFNWKPLDMLRSVGQLGLPSDALLQCRVFTALLRTAPRRFAVRTLPAGASAGDLAPRRFVLPASKLADSPAALLSSRVGGALFEARRAVEVVVWVSATREEKLTLRTAAAKYSDIVAALRKLLNTVEQRTVAFACVGCGRKLRREEEDVQEVPTKCCRQKSLVLRLVRRSKKRGTQATLLARTSDEACQTEGPMTQDGWSQVSLCHPKKSCMTQTSTCVLGDIPQSPDAAPPVAVRAKEASVKAPLNDFEAVQFFICNWSRLGRHNRDFRCTLLLPKDPLVSDVLNALVAELNVAPDLVRLKQWRAKAPDGRPLTWVCRQAGYPGDEYGDSDGSIYRRKEVVEDAGEDLYDAHPFPIVPGRRNIVVVNQI